MPGPHLNDDGSGPGLYSDLQNTGAFKRTCYKHTADYDVASTTWTTIDAVNVPALGLELNVGDVVEMALSAQITQTSAGNVVLFNWLIDRPVSADVLLSALKGEAAAGLWYPSSAGYELPMHLVRTFVATEAGLHTFLPQFKTNGTGIGRIIQTGTYGRALEHIVKRLGPAL